MHKRCTTHTQSMRMNPRRAKHVRERVLTYVLTIGLTAPVAALAQDRDTFSLPQGCEAYLTVQSASCQVDHHFTCEGDPDGHQQRVSFDEDYMTYSGSVDRETQWVGRFHPLTGHSERLEDNPVDPASLSELIQTGRDSYDFKTLSDEIGTTRYVGADELTGNVVTIDDIALDETSYQITAFAEDGTELWSSSGNEYISRDWRVFMAGTGVTTVPGDRFEKDDRPVEFIFPGERGFLSTNPKHGCGVVMSSYVVTP